MKNCKTGFLLHCNADNVNITKINIFFQKILTKTDRIFPRSKSSNSISELCPSLSGTTASVTHQLSRSSNRITSGKVRLELPSRSRKTRFLFTRQVIKLINILIFFLC